MIDYQVTDVIADDDKVYCKVIDSNGNRFVWDPLHEDAHWF